MRATWKPDNREPSAIEIAAHTNIIVQQMQKAGDKADVQTLLKDWHQYARTRRVCQPIIDAVEQVAEASIRELAR